MCNYYERMEDPSHEPEQYCYQCEDVERRFNRKMKDAMEYLEGIKEAVYLDPVFSNEKFQHCFEMLCDYLDVPSDLGDVKSIEVIRERGEV